MNRSRLRNESGFSLLSFAVILSALLVVLMYFTIGRSAETAKRMGQNMSMSFANDISIKLAQKIRLAYDIAKVEEDPSTPQPGLCASKGGAIFNLSAAVHLCAVGNEICVDHPRGTGTVCVKPSDGTLVAKMPARMGTWWLNEAYAQVSDRPADPTASDTSNALTVNPVCLDGACNTTCSVNADCVTYRFCPLFGTCNADQFVWQTIALLR